MSPKNETTVLVLAFLVTAGLLGGGFWLFKNSGMNSPTPINPANPPPISASQNFNQVANVPSGLFNYGGSTSWATIRFGVDSAIKIARPEFQLRYLDPIGNPPGSSSGIKMLLDGQLAFSQSSRPLKDQEYQQAQQRGFTLIQIPVAIDGLAIAVNPNLNLPGLTLTQLKAIYTGQITNWQQVGGANLPIKPYSRFPNTGGTVDFFIEEILGGEKFGNNVEFIATTTQALRWLGKNPGGIYYASAPEVVPQCGIKPLPLGRKAGEFVPPYQEPFVSPQQCPNQRNHVNFTAFQKGEYPITRNFFVIVKQNGQIEQQAGIAYANLLLTVQGQELIAAQGFVKIR